MPRDFDMEMAELEAIAAEEDEPTQPSVGLQSTQAAPAFDFDKEMAELDAIASEEEQVQEREEFTAPATFTPKEGELSPGQEFVAPTSLARQQETIIERKERKNLEGRQKVLKGDVKKLRFGLNKQLKEFDANTGFQEVQRSLGAKQVGITTGLGPVAGGVVSKDETEKANELKGQREIIIAKNFIKEMQLYIDADVDADVKHIMRRIGRNPYDLLPFSPSSMIDLLRVNAIVKKQRNGQALNESEELKLAEFATEEKLRQEQGQSMPASIFEGVVNMIPYAAEFLITNGLATGVRAGVKKAVGTTIKSSIKRKVLTAVGAEVVVAGMRTALNPAGFGADYIKRTLPEMDISENDGKYVIDYVHEGQGGGEAFFNTLISRMAEYGTESSGEYLKLLGPAARNKLARMAFMQTFLKNNPKAGTTGFKQFMEKAGVSGFLEEMGEEQLNRIINAIAGVDMTPEDKADIGGRVRSAFWQDMEQFLIEAGTLAIPTLPGHVTQFIANKEHSKGSKINKVRNHYKTAGITVNSEQAGKILDVIEEETPPIVKEQAVVETEAPKLTEEALEEEKRAVAQDEAIEEREPTVTAEEEEIKPVVEPALQQFDPEAEGSLTKQAFEFGAQFENNPEMIQELKDESKRRDAELDRLFAEADKEEDPVKAALLEEQAIDEVTQQQFFTEAAQRAEKKPSTKKEASFGTGEIDVKALVTGKVAPVAKQKKKETKPKPKKTEKVAPKAEKELSPKEALHRGEKVKMPKGTTFVRITTKDGKISTVSIKDTDTLKGAGPFKKVEFGVKGQKGFAPRTKGDAFPAGQSTLIDQALRRQIPESADKQEFKLFEETKALLKKYAARIGEGSTPSYAAGVYYRKTGNVFVDALNDIFVVVHEASHAVESKTQYLSKILKTTGTTKDGKPIYSPNTLKERKMLTKIYEDYYPTGSKKHPLRKRMVEGIATFLQKYVENPEEMAKEYPELVGMFLKKSGKYYDPLFVDVTNDARAIVNRYAKLDGMQKILSRVTKETQKVEEDNRLLNNKDRALKVLVDDIFPAEAIAKRAGVHFTPKDPSLWMRMFRNIGRIFAHNVSPVRVGRRKTSTFLALDEKGDWKEELPYNWHSLINDLTNEGIADQFTGWLIARRAFFNYKKLDEMKKAAKEAKEELKTNKDPKERKELKQTIREFKSFAEVVRRDGWDRNLVTEQYNKYKGPFSEYAKKYDTMVREDLKMLKKSGILSGKEFEEYAKNEGYATWKRDFYNEIVDQGGGSNKAIFVAGTRIAPNIPSSSVTAMRRRVGGLQTIIDPIYGAIINHNEILRKSMRQIVINKWADLADSLPGSFQKLDLKRIFDPDTGKTYYPQEKLENILMARRNGKRTPYLVSKEIQSVINEVMTPKGMEVAERILRAVSGLFVKGTTGWFPPFVASNYVVDQITAAAQTRNAYKPLATHIKELYELVAHKSSEEADYWREYLILTGGGQTMMKMHDMTPAELEKVILGEKKAIDKFIQTIDKVGNVLGAPVQASEILTRGSEYVLSRKAGKPQVIAIEEAARVTGSFTHRGTMGGNVGRAWVSSLPYFKASKQVLAMFGETIADPKRRKQAAIVVSMVMAAKLTEIMALLVASDDQKDKYKDIKPEMFSLYIFYPHPNGKDFLRFRIPEQMGALAATINLMISEAIYGADYSVEDYMSALNAWIPEQFNPTQPIRMFLSWIPQPIKPGLETAFNKRTWPSVRDLVPKGMTYMEPRFQAFPNTSKVAKIVGEQFNLSPIKIDHLIEGYFGRTSRYFTLKPGVWEKTLDPFHQRVYFMSGLRMENFWIEANENDQLMNSLKNEKREFSEDERQTIKLNARSIARVRKHLKSYRKVEDLNSERAQEIREKILDDIDTIE